MEEMRKERVQNPAADRQPQDLHYTGLIINGIMHSFNNAIGVIRGYADLSLRATDRESSIYPYLESIIDGADSIKELSDKMQIFGKQEQKDHQIVHIHSIVEEAVNAFAKQRTPPAEIQKNIDPACGAVLADAGQIRQVVINLCRNAYEAIGKNNGMIEVALKEMDVEAEGYQGLIGGRYVKLTVSDAGCGMDQAILKRIYEPFFTTKKADEHAGLGLTVVAAVVSGHLGKIIAESQSGEGTTIDIYLPLAGKSK